MQKSMFKKILSLIMALVMALSLVACGNGNKAVEDPAQSNTPVQTEDKENIVIGWSNCTATAFASAADNYIENQCAKYDNVTLYMTNAGGDGAKQVADIEDLITKGCDAILVFAIDASTVTNILKEAEQKGILVICVQRKLQEDVGIYVGPDMSAAGTELASHFLNAFGDEGFNCCWLMGENGNLSNIEAKAGFDAAIAETGRTDIKELDAKNSNSSRAESKTIVENWITAYGEDMDVILAGNDELAMGAIMALEEAGMSDKVKVSGINATAEILPYLVDGPVDITFAVSGGTFPAVEMAIDILSGNNVYADSYKIPIYPITPENIGSYYDLVMNSGLYMLGQLQPYENPIFQAITGTYPEIDALIDMIPR